MAKKTYNQRVNIFFDLEFTGLHKLTTPISIALIGEDGRKYYAEFTDYDEYQVDKWIDENVISKLVLNDNYKFEEHYDPEAQLVAVKGNIQVVKETMTKWLEYYSEDGIQLIGDVLAYDWILFVSIFGNAFDLPEFISYIPLDISTLLFKEGIDTDADRGKLIFDEKQYEAYSKDTHNSLQDAITIKLVFDKFFNKKTKQDEGKDENTDNKGDDNKETENIEANTDSRDIEQKQDSDTTQDTENIINKEGMFEVSQEEINNISDLTN